MQINVDLTGLNELIEKTKAFPAKQTLAAIKKEIKENIEAIRQRDPAATSDVEVLLLYSGLHATLAYRVAHKLYLGGHKSVGTLTVRDSSGNVQTVSFGDMVGNYYREVTIDADGNSDLEVTYSLACGVNITAVACVKY